MAYGPEAAELRRCRATRADGGPCRGWAVWGDETRRCLKHGGRSSRSSGMQPTQSRYIPCRCPAYQWPHRPARGLCRWPLPPEAVCPTPEGTPSPVARRRPEQTRRLRGIARRAKEAALEASAWPSAQSFEEAWAIALEDEREPAWREEEVVARARRRWRRGQLAGAGEGSAWAAVPRGDRRALLECMVGGRWAGLVRVPGTEDEWALYAGPWKVRGLWDGEELVVLAVIAVA